MKRVDYVWVRIPQEDPIKYKKMSEEQIRNIARVKDLVIAKNGIFFDIDEYTFSPEEQTMKTYGFVTGHYTTNPHIDLVPRGTTFSYGRYEYQK